MILTWLILCACFFTSALCYTDQLLYQAAEDTPSHHVWVRQTEEEGRANSGQRRVRQVQTCETPSRQRGSCVRMEDCVLRDIYQDYVKNRGYFCVLRNKGGIGVCCPESLSTPVTYRDGIFFPSSTARPNGSRGTTSQQLQQSTTSTTPATLNRATTSSSASTMDDSYALGDFRVCGRNGKKISGITQAAPTTVKDWPWMAALIYRTTGKQFCGGTTITRRHVLTAAHCFPRADPNEVMVILGDYDLKRMDDSKSRLFSVVQMTIHEDFDVTTYENDIAILLLNTTTAYNSYIQPCCLPAPGPKYVNLTAVVTGWGKLEFGGLSPSVLMEVPVPVWDLKRCSPNFAQTVFDTNICAAAYEGGKDACQGDSGGPLVMQRRDQRWAIIGIVSWGIRCGEKDKPGIYTKVNDYLDWIAQTIL